MFRLVLDTNSLIQSLPIKSKYHDLWVSLFDGRNTFCVSNEILEEYEEIQADKDDNKFVDCAVCGNAKFIVTEDHHFDILRQVSFPKVDVSSLDDIMNYL